MKVKIGDTVYDSEETAIMLILSDQDKYNISHMSPNDGRYCCFPDEMEIEEVKKFMETDEE